MWTRRDPLLSQVKLFIQSGWPAAVEPQMKPYWSHRLELTVENGCIVWGSRVVIPSPGRQCVLQQLHEGHPGMARIKGLATMYMWWSRWMRMWHKLFAVAMSVRKFKQHHLKPLSNHGVGLSNRGLGCIWTLLKSFKDEYGTFSKSIGCWVLWWSGWMVLNDVELDIGNTSTFHTALPVYHQRNWCLVNSYVHD